VQGDLLAQLMAVCVLADDSSVIGCGVDVEH
jgi:hypothetical protein